MKNLKNIRIAKNLTVRQLDHLSGVSAAMIYAIERGDRVPGIEIALRLAKALGTTIEALM